MAVAMRRLLVANRVSCPLLSYFVSLSSCLFHWKNSLVHHSSCTCDTFSPGNSLTAFSCFVPSPPLFLFFIFFFLLTGFPLTARSAVPSSLPLGLCQWIVGANNMPVLFTPVIKVPPGWSPPLLLVCRASLHCHQSMLLQLREVMLARSVSHCPDLLPRLSPLISYPSHHLVLTLPLRSLFQFVDYVFFSTVLGCIWPPGKCENENKASPLSRNNYMCADSRLLFSSERWHRLQITGILYAWLACLMQKRNCFQNY